ncbi:hypothetical protein P171DRAFT_473082 [Karstenula rhodostoma CBS 690.94]|uniref:Uncharacterized protein n=1 Tax=Karstenula rhodostoma CBS 690.94 TaxID=1392251 RepID=A0A9P4PJC2_9PLEO|nr:hypothetical protein P171DRAFT_473082 [Karstenula rhodostoma CBS 690.94]
MSFLGSSIVRSAALRPSASIAARAQFHTVRALRTGDYGSGDGNPNAEKPQQQGKRGREDLEHPGPAPPKAGQGNKTSPDSDSFNSSSSGKSSSGSSSAESTAGDGKKAEATDKDVKGVKVRPVSKSRPRLACFVFVTSGGVARIMRFSTVSALVVALAAQATANSWFGKPVYNKWHETELERWLSDNNIPYPTPSDRKHLENLVKDNWNDKVVSPYTSWDTQTLTNYLTSKGQQAKKGTDKDAKSLAEQVKVYWTETEESANQAYGSVKDWIFDSWTDSQLKSFADKHGIPVPQPRQRDSLLKAVRENYQTTANKLSESVNYPGDWLYESWSDSDLKAWFDERGYPVPQPSTRDGLIANIRRQSRVASLNLQGAYTQVSSSAAAAQQSLSDALLDSWSDSQIKEWADKNGVKVPQGSKRNELIALARKHRARLYGDSASATVESAYGAATSQAGNQYAAATGGFAGYTNWIKAQIGLATDAAAASASSATGVAAKSVSSGSAAASKSAAAASSSASKSSAAASSSASKSAASGSSSASKSSASASKSVNSAYTEAAASAASATDRVKNEL